MTQTFTMDQLEAIARRVIGDSRIRLAPDGVAAKVPGWDSLSHTLIMLEINDSLRIDLSAQTAAAARDFGHLVDMVNEKVRRGAGA